MHLRTRPALAWFRPPVTVVLCLDGKAGDLERGWPLSASPLAPVRHSRATICGVA